MSKPDFLKTVLTKTRLIPAIVALSVSASLLNLAWKSVFQYGVVYDGFYWWVLCDYMVWLATILVCFAAYLDLKAFWRGFGYASTLMLTLVGFVLSALGRAASFCLNASQTIPIYIGPLFGSYYTWESLLVAAFCLITGSTLTSVSLLIHTVLGRPIVFKESVTFADLFKRQRLILLKTWNRIWSKPYSYLIIAFLIGFSHRLVPELLWWPWPVGWDTVEYIAHLMDFTETLNPFTSYYWMGSMRNCPPLLNIILLPVASVIGAWNAFKIYPPIAYGMLALSSALLAKKTLGLSRLGSLFASIVTTFYVLNLRMSGDYQRQLLGSVFMTFTLTAMDSWKKLDLKKTLITSLLILCCALSHEVTALFSAGVSLVLIIKSVENRDYNGLVAGLIGLSASVLLETWYWKRPYTPSKVFGIIPAGLVSYSEDVSAAVFSYVLAGYGLTLPFAVAALFKNGLTYTKTGFIILLLAGVSPMLAPYTSAATWYRFLIGIAPLASTLAAAGVCEMSRDKRFYVAYLVLIIVPGLLFAYSVSSLSRFAGAIRELTSGFTPVPSSIEALKDLEKLIEWIDTQSINEPVVVDWSIQNWVRIAVRNANPEKFIRASSITSETLLTILEKTQAEKIYVVSTRDLDEGNQSICVKKLREGLYKVYLIEAQDYPPAEKHSAAMQCSE
ncbi:MAG: hypothetical protein QXP99_02560 [Thermoproteota archaeon]